jgi:hypothetical protein
LARPASPRYTRCSFCHRSGSIRFMGTNHWQTLVLLRESSVSYMFFTVLCSTRCLAIYCVSTTPHHVTTLCLSL